jgi:nitroreductase
MVRSFASAPIASELVDRLLGDAVRAPTAGNARGVAWLVLEGAQTADYWQLTTTPAWRATSRRWPGLAPAPVVALCLTSPAVYVQRYSEPDKASSGLGAPPSGGTGTAAWPVPYWFGDAAFATMTLLLGAVDVGLGACFLGNFRGETDLLHRFGVPGGWRLFGSVLLGHPAPGDHRSASLDRATPSRWRAVHRGCWAADPS